MSLEGETTMTCTPIARRRQRLLVVLVALVVAITLAPPAASSQQFEFTPFVGYRWGGGFSSVDRDFSDISNTDFSVSDASAWGAMADFSLTDNWQLEILYSRQETDLRIDEGFLAPDDPLFDMNVEYLHGGLLYQWRLAGIRPYLTGGLGGTKFSPVDSDARSETRFSFNFGGGAKVFFGDHFGLRADARFFETYISDKDEVFCDRFGCFRVNVGEYLTQFQMAGGIIFAF